MPREVGKASLRRASLSVALYELRWLSKGELQGCQPAAFMSPVGLTFWRRDLRQYQSRHSVWQLVRLVAILSALSSSAAAKDTAVFLNPLFTPGYTWTYDTVFWSQDMWAAAAGKDDRNVVRGEYVCAVSATINFAKLQAIASRIVCKQNSEDEVVPDPRSFKFDGAFIGTHDGVWLLGPHRHTGPSHERDSAKVPWPPTKEQVRTTIINESVPFFKRKQTKSSLASSVNKRTYTDPSGHPYDEGFVHERVFDGEWTIHYEEMGIDPGNSTISVAFSPLVGFYKSFSLSVDDGDYQSGWTVSIKRHGKKSSTDNRNGKKKSKAHMSPPQRFFK